ncbi:uncharacterized protein LOC100378543 [Saccoglossus kowalevskii]
MSQQKSATMTKGQRSTKNSRNLRYLNLSFAVDTSSKNNGRRPHGGYKVCHVVDNYSDSQQSPPPPAPQPLTHTSTSTSSGVPNHHPPSILSFNKPPEYIESVKNEVAAKQERERMEPVASPSWIHGVASSRNHTGEFPLFTHHYLSSSKMEQIDPGGSVHRSLSASARSDNEFYRPNRMHQYLTATEMPGESEKVVDIKLGRPTRTSLLRARHRSQSAPSLNSSQLDIRHLHTIGQITDSANKPKKKVLQRDLLPPTGRESLHQFLTGARYNRARWIDNHPATKYSMYSEYDSGCLPPYGSEVSSSSGSSTSGDQTPPKEKESLPPAVRSSTPASLKEITQILEVEAEERAANEISTTLGKPKCAWDGEKGGGGDNLASLTPLNTSRETFNSDNNNSNISMLTPKKIMLLPPEEKTICQQSQHELKRHPGIEATCLFCRASNHDEIIESNGKCESVENQQYMNTQKPAYENGEQSKHCMSIQGTKLGFSSTRPKITPRRKNLEGKPVVRSSYQQDADQNQNEETETEQQNKKEPDDEIHKENAERTETENVKDNIAEIANKELVNTAAQDVGNNDDEDADADEGVVENNADGSINDDNAHDENVDGLSVNNKVVEECTVNTQKEVEDTDAHGETVQLDTYRSEVTETPRSEGEDMSEEISVSVTMKDREQNDEDSRKKIDVEDDVQVDEGEVGQTVGSNHD